MICFLLVILLNTSLPSNQQIEDAKNYMEAKTFQKAKNELDQLLEKDLPDWQKNIVTYDLGTVYLNQGNYEKAYEQLKKVSTDDASPLLKRSLYLNLSITLFEKAKELLNILTVETASKALFLFREAELYIDKAIISDCELSKLMGQKKCQKSQKLVDLKNEIIVALGQLLGAIDEIESKQDLYLLFAANQSALKSLDFLLKIDSNKEYQSFFVAQLKTWLPIWKTMETVFSFRLFEQGLAYLNQGLLDKSQESFKKNEERLNELMHRLWGKDSNIEILTNLLTSYHFALEQKPLQETSLLALLQQQNQIYEFFDKTKEVDRATHDLEQTLKVVQNGDEKLARLYLLHAMHTIKRLIPETSSGLKPLDSLNQAIEEQNFTLKLTRASEDLTLNETVLALIVDSQKYVIEAAKIFLKDVTLYQEQMFQQECQKYPWTELLPLFDQGLLEAKKAVNLLELSKEEAMEKQEHVLMLWKQAKKHFQKPEKVKRPKETTEPKKEKKIPIEDVMRQIQQMERQDRKPRKIQLVPGGEKPW